MAGDALDNQQAVIGAEQALRFLDEASAILAGSLEYETTLGAIAQLTVPVLADWCAVDVVQDDGTLRQITSGHPQPEQEELLMRLRARYRAEKGGSEGVLRVVASGEPELFEDVRGAGARIEIAADEAELYERLGPRSYLIVPLVARGRTLGAMTLLSTQEGRHYGPGDLAFAQHLARRFALAVDNARLYGEAEESRALLDAFVTSTPVGVALLDTELRYMHVNPALAALNGIPVEDHIGRTPTEVLGRDAAAPVEQVLRGVLETGRPQLDLEATTPLPSNPHETRHWLTSFTPLRGPDGAIAGVSGVIIDVTDRRRALDAERDATRRARFMAQAGAVLDASMDYEELLRRLAHLSVPDFADWCVVSLIDDDGDLTRVAVAHADPALTRSVREMLDRYPTRVDPASGVGRVLATGEPEVVHDVTDDLLAAAAHDAEHLEMLRRLGLRAGVTAPLVARGRILGAIAFIAAESDRRYSEADVQLLVELGRRAGVAIENARLYTERSRIAHTLQARLLPSRLPQPSGVRLAARYRAAGEFNEVGGDFYDAFRRAPEEWVVVIGDVSGKGPEAAALTALARYTIRSAALNDWAPGHVLRRLNDTLLQEEDSQFVTVALAFVSHDGDHVRVRLVLAGHPPPCLVRADGTVEPVGEPGTLLGIQGDIRLHEVEATLAPGDAIVFYTDGVIEAGPRQAPLGEDGVIALLRGLGGADPEELVAAVDAAARDADPGRARDDVAIVALQAAEVVPPPETVEISRPAEAAHLHDLREAVVLLARRVSGVDPEAVRLAVGEACTNVVVHAYRLAESPGEIHVRALVADDGLVVEIRDEGCGASPRLDSPGLGLGLPLMARLSRELQILDREPSGTLVRMTF